jgi:hypothetical protein
VDPNEHVVLSLDVPVEEREVILVVGRILVEGQRKLPVNRGNPGADKSLYGEGIHRYEEKPDKPDGQRGVRR